MGIFSRSRDAHINVQAPHPDNKHANDLNLEARSKGNTYDRTIRHPNGVVIEERGVEWEEQRSIGMGFSDGTHVAAALERYTQVAIPGLGGGGALDHTRYLKLAEAVAAPDAFKAVSRKI